MKRLFAVLLCLVLCFSITAVAVQAAGDTYVVAGSDQLCNGELWAASSDVNTMKAKSNGTYSLVLKNVPVGNYEFKIVKNGSEWIGDPDNWGNNYSLSVKKSCDVTITYDPATGYATASGSGVGDAVAPDISVMGIRGEGLDILDWGTDIVMEKVKDSVYEYTFQGLSAATLSIKFAANGNWDDYNFGGSFEGSGVKTNAAWFGENITFAVEELSDVTVRLDLTSLDYSTKQGATYTITVTPVPEETEATEATTEPVATEPSQTDATETVDEPVETDPENADGTQTGGAEATEPVPEEDGNDSNTGLIIGIAAAVLAAAAVIVCVILKKKKA